MRLAPKTMSWKGRIYILAMAQMVTMMAAQFSSPFLPLFIKEELGVKESGEAAFLAGASQGLLALAMIFTGPLWGIVGDRYGLKKNVLRAMVGTALTLGLTGFATNVTMFVVLRVLYGAFTGITVALTAMAASFSPKERLGYSMGIIQGASFLGSTLGPLAGGVMSDAMGFKEAFLATGLVLSINFFVVLFLIHEEFKPSPRVKGGAGALQGIKEILSSGGFRVALLVLFMVQVAPMLYSPVLPLFIERISNLPAATISGAVFAIIGISGALSAFVVARILDRVGARRVLFISCLGAGAFYIPLFFATNIIQVVVLLALASLFKGGLLISANTLIGKSISSERHGVAYGVSQSAFALAFGVGPLTGGILARQVGLEEVFLFNASAFFVVGFVTLWLLKGERARAPRAAVS